MDERALELVPTERRAFARLLWSEIPPTGEPIGNVALRDRTRTTSSDDYWAVRNAMVAAGLIVLGYGRGGSVRRSSPYVAAVSSDVVEARRAGLELSLYRTIADRLEGVVKDEDRFDTDKVAVAITGIQGRRATGGKWSRPDITLVGAKTFRVLAGAHLEVQTYEVKTASGFDMIALHEARAHRRRAHRSYVIVDLEDATQEDAIGQLVDEARDLGVGLISFLHPDDQWKYWNDPPIVLPDPVELDDFLNTQLPEESRARIRSWYALPALGGTD